MNNQAMLKAMAGHFRKNADAHTAHAESARTRMNCCKGLSECMKLAGLQKGDKQDFHDEMASTYSDDADRHDASAQRCTKLAAACDKAAGELPAGASGSDGKSSNVELNLDGDASAKIATTVIDTLRKEFGNMIVPDGVQKTFRTSDPNAPGPGLSLVPRAGAATPPTDFSRLPAELQEMVRE